MQDNEQKTLGRIITLVVFILIIAFGSYVIGFDQGKSSVKSTSNNKNSSQTVTVKSLTPILGSPSAKLLIKEYADYQCPYCSEFNQTILPQLESDYINTNKIKFQFINAPLLGDESVYSAAAAYCANDQGKYWQYHNELYLITSQKNGDESHPVLNKGIFSQANLESYASTVGLNMNLFDQCLNSSKYVSTVVNEATAATQAGVNGTPYFIIGNQPYEGLPSYSILQSLIQAQL